jgi:NAD+ kinase
MLDLKRVGLFVRDDEQDYPAASMAKLFNKVGVDFVSDASQAEPGSLDLVLALGGDGTVLRALVAHPDTPVLAVNYGNVGFLTQSDRDQLDKVLVRLLSDEYFIEDRLTLEIRYGDQVYRSINEVVLRGASHMIEVQVHIDGRLIHTPRGDGVIVGTPTGSTAYLLSTGAPIVVPDVDCIVLNPLNEYSFSSRSIILPGSSHIRLTVDACRESDVGIAIDGDTRIPLSDGDSIEIVRSQKPARLVCFESDYFFRNLKERLRW